MAESWDAECQTCLDGQVQLRGGVWNGSGICPDCRRGAWGQIHATQQVRAASAGRGTYASGYEHPVPSGGQGYPASPPRYSAPQTSAGWDMNPQQPRTTTMYRQPEPSLPAPLSPRRPIALKVNIFWIPPYLNADWLEHVFKPFGRIQEAYIEEEPEDGEPGYGFVIFEDSNDADEALKKFKNGKKMFATNPNGTVSMTQQRLVFTVENAEQD